LKDAREEHFKVDVNVSDVNKNVGIDEHTKFNATFTKYRVAILSGVNIIDMAFTRAKCQMRKQIGSSFPFVLSDMIQSDQFHPTISWVVPTTQEDMDSIFV
jgi:nicotinate-nucleotide pyrophosphorylase